MRVLITRNKATGDLEIFTKKRLLREKNFEAERERRFAEAIPEQCIHRLYGDMYCK